MLWKFIIAQIELEDNEKSSVTGRRIFHRFSYLMMRRPQEKLRL